MGCSSSQPSSKQQSPQQHKAAPAKSQSDPQQPERKADNCGSEQSSSSDSTNEEDKDEEKTDIKVKAVKLDKHVLEKYLELERKTREYESKNVLKSLKAKEEQVQDLDETIKALEAHYKQCITQTEKERADVEQMKDASVKNFFKDQMSYDAKFSKEQEEYLDALNKQEIAKKELDGVKKQRDQVQSKCKVLKTEADKLQKIYQEQDELLAGIFNGKYGSDLEYKLESEVDMLLDKKQRISVAKYKWQNARVVLQHAVNQLATAVKRWTDVQKVKADNLQSRYKLATEARNNIVAASLNLSCAQKYLHTITFPYCKPEEVVTLNRAVNNIYTDMASQERHNHAMQCYNTSHRRAAALLQWFDHVISKTIEKDLTESTKKVDGKTKELRKERLRLIKEKVRETTGNTVNLDNDHEMDLEDGPEPELMALEATQADKVTDVKDLPAGKEGSGEVNDAASGDTPGPTTTPMSLNELAPAPNTEDLFGDIDNLKKQHEQEMEEFSKAQVVNKTRMEQGLQEKLKARRSRRNRQDQQ